MPIIIEFFYFFIPSIYHIHYIDTVGKNYLKSKYDINRSMPTFDPKLCWNTICRATWMISNIPYKT